jgi:hypothetical protein
MLSQVSGKMGPHGCALNAGNGFDFCKLFTATAQTWHEFLNYIVKVTEVDAHKFTKQAEKVKKACMPEN